MAGLDWPADPGRFCRYTCKANLSGKSVGLPHGTLRSRCSEISYGIIAALPGIKKPVLGVAGGRVAKNIGNPLFFL